VKVRTDNEIDNEFVAGRLKDELKILENGLVIIVSNYGG